MELNVKKEKLKKTKVKLSVEVPVKIFEEFKKDALDKLAKQVEVKGFRKGKVPAKVAKKYLEEGKIEQEALQMALPEVYGKVIVDESLKPVGQPKVKIKQFEQDKSVKIEYTVDLLPNIKLPDYKNLKAKKEKASLTKKEISQGLDGLRKRMADYEDKTGKVEKGDWVEVSLEGKLKGAKVDQFSSDNHPFIIGDGGFIDGFEDEIKGMKKDDKKTFKLKLPEDHPDKDMAGKEVKFEVELKEVKKVKEASLNEVAKKMGAKDVKDLKVKFKEAQKKQLETEIEKKYEQDLITKLVDNAKFEVPEALVKQEYERINREQEHQLVQQEMTKEQYFKKFRIDEKDYDKKLKESAKKNVEVALVLNQLAKVEKIKPSQKETKAKTESMISQGMVQGGDKMY